MKKGKILAVVGALALTLTMLAGCGESTLSNLDLHDDVLNLEGSLCSAEPLTLTIHLHFWGTNIFDDEWPIYKEAAKKTNITLHGTASKTSTDSDQEFNTMLVGDVLPDIIHNTSVNMNKAGRDGAVIPLQDLVKKYAPHIQEYFDKYPEAYKASVDTDGNLYYIPQMRDDNGPTMGWFIREDWLTKLGLKVPDTKDEYYNVLKAFRDQDPNGNGKKDEVPFMNRQKNINVLLPLWGVSQETYVIDDNGKVIANRTTEEYKTAIKEIAQWYKEGLIDQEIFTRSNAREELFGNNQGGATNDWFSSTMSFNTVEADKVPGFHLMSIPPVKDINGVRQNFFSRSVVSAIGWGISKDNKYIAETMKFFDFWFTEEGKQLVAMGVEGVHWNYDENGVAQYTDLVMSYTGGGAPNYMRTIGGNEIGTYAELWPEIAGMTGEAQEAFKNYAEAGWAVKPFPATSKTPEEQRILTEKETNINTYSAETLQNWIMGNTDIDSTWDEYINTVKSMGLDEVIEVYQTAYDRVYK